MMIALGTRAHLNGQVREMRSTDNLTAKVTDMFHFPLNLLMVRSLAWMILAAILVPALAQTPPGILNKALAVGTVGYGVIEAGDGNFYAMSLPNPNQNHCADSSNLYCAYIYQITKGGTLSTYHSFQAPSSTGANADGLEPTALIEGTDGNLYGACRIGGPGQFGTIFKITPTGTFTVLASFAVTTVTVSSNGLDPGSNPVSLIQGIDGNLYFVNATGVYSLNPNVTAPTVTTIATFPYGLTEGSDPDGYNASSIMQANDGNFYLTMGTTPNTLAGDPGVNAGGIVQVTPGGQLNLVHAFAIDGSEGNQPQGPLVEGPDGYLYGTTTTSNSGGTVAGGLAFKALPSAGGAFISLGPLPSTSAGRPSNALFVGSDGNLYGTSVLGGNLTAAHCAGIGCGMLFQMTPAGTFTTVYAFQGGSAASPNAPPLPTVDGAGPEAPVVQSDNGEFIGSSSGFTDINSPVFFDLNLGGKVVAPVKLTLTPANAGVNTPVTASWTVLNAFSDTAQNCGAVVQGGLPAISGWSGQQTGGLANGVYSGSRTITPTQPGAYTLGLVCGGNEVGFASLQVSQGLHINTLSLPDGLVGTKYPTTIVTASGGQSPFGWTVTGLPAGLSLAITGDSVTISGTPIQWGSANVTFTVTDSSTPALQDTQTLALKIDSSLKIILPSFEKATVNARFLQTVKATGGIEPIKWSVVGGTLPPGLSLYDITGQVLGTPTQTGNYIVTFQVQDAEATPATDTKTYTIKIVPTIQIAAVEFTQVIQQYQALDDLTSTLTDFGEPPVPILSGKPGVMRVYFTSLKDATDVSLTVTGAVAGMKAMNLPPNCAPGDSRMHLRNCPSMDFYFTPPSGAWSTVLTLDDDQGNQLEQETFAITSRDTQAINLKGASVCVVKGQPSSCQDPSVLLGLTGIITELLPTSSVPPPTITTIKIPSDISDWPTTSEWEDFTAKQIDEHYTSADQATDASSNMRTDYIGLYNSPIDDTAQGEIGGHGVLMPSQTIRLRQDNTPYTLTHEVGHTLNLYHTNNGNPLAVGGVPPGCWSIAATGGADGTEYPPYWPYSDNRVQSSLGDEWGFDVANGSVVNPYLGASGVNNVFDIMSYCVPRWISPLNYKRALLFVNGGPATAPSFKGGPVQKPDAAQPKARRAVTYNQGSYMHVTGSIASTGVTIDPIFTQNTVGTTDPGSGPYSIQLRAATGQVLFTRNFTPTSDATETLGTDHVSDPHFSEFIPATSGTAAIAIVDPTGNTLTSVSVSGSAPKVTITSPVAGFVGSGQQTVSWTATSATATTFTSEIFYSTDAGTTWLPVEITPASSDVLDFNRLPGASAALIRVDVSDGVNTGSATSVPFNVPKKLPSTIVINSPQNGAVRPAADPIYLSGAAYDADDGVLSGKSLKWSDSEQGALGSGTPLTVSLKPGNHTITLTATDSDGNALTATTVITLGGDPPAVTLSTAQTSNCFNATVNATPGASGADLTEVDYSIDGGATYTPIALTGLPFTLPLKGTGVVDIAAVAVDASGQVSAQSAQVNLGAGCTSNAVKANAGSNQNTVVGSVFATALTSQVVDLNGNPVSGITVTYAAPASGASATLSATTATTNASGIATVTATANNTAGAYNITASAPNGSSTATFSLTNSDFQIAAAAGTLSVPRGSSATDVITLTALGGFNGTVTFGCQGLPAGATCTFTPATVTPAAATAITTMTVAASQTASLRLPVGGGSIVACALLACFIRRRKYFNALAIIASVTALISLTACGSSTHKQPTTASVTVTASVGSVQRTTTVTLEIQ